MNSLIYYFGKSLMASPTLSYLVWKLRPDKNNELLVERDTKLVIEGYPRSANTFLYQGFRIAQDADLKVAHHLHIPGQILRGLKFKIPCVLCLRNPADAIVSHCIREENFKIKDAIRYYIDFHKPLISRKNEFFIAHFEEITGDINSVIKAINSRFNKSFQLIPGSKSEIDISIFNAIRRNRPTAGSNRIAMPDKKRNKLKQEMLKELEGEKNRALLKEAINLYQILLN